MNCRLRGEADSRTWCGEEEQQAAMAGRGPLESMLREHLIDIASSENLEIPNNLESEILTMMKDSPSEARFHGLTKHVILLLKEIRRSEFLHPPAVVAPPVFAAPAAPVYSRAPPRPKPPPARPLHSSLGPPPMEYCRPNGRVNGRATANQSSRKNSNSSLFNGDKTPDDDSFDEHCFGGTTTTPSMEPLFASEPAEKVAKEELFDDGYPEEQRDAFELCRPPWASNQPAPSASSQNDRRFEQRPRDKAKISSRTHSPPPPLLKKNVCPFCTHRFSCGIPTVKTLFTHFSRAHHYEAVQGSFFTCTACPHLKWRSTRCLVHLELELCGGAIVFEHDPTWTEEQSVQQNKNLKKIRRSAGSYNGPNGSFSEHLAASQPKRSKPDPLKQFTAAFKSPPQNSYSNGSFKVPQVNNRAIRASPSSNSSESNTPKHDRDPPYVPGGLTTPGSGGAGCPKMRSADSRFFGGEDRLRLQGMDTCPFCEHAFQTSDISCVTLYKHIKRRHPVNCAILGCSACPDLHLASSGPLVVHLKKNVCGGRAVFDHRPDISAGRPNFEPCPDDEDDPSYGATAIIRTNSDPRPLESWKLKRKEAHLRAKITSPASATTPNSQSNGHHHEVQLRVEGDPRFLLHMANCPFCDKAFQTRNVSAFSFDKHMQTTHTDMRGTFYRCSTCPSFLVRSATSMKAHFKSRKCKGHTLLDHRPDVSNIGGFRRFAPGKEGQPSGGSEGYDTEGGEMADDVEMDGDDFEEEPTPQRPVDPNAPPLLPSTKCPFCPHKFATGMPTVWSLNKHFHRAAHIKDIPGAFFKCSKCTDMRWRAANGALRHIDKDSCGGSIVFDHCAEWNGSATSTQSLEIKRSRRSAPTRPNANGFDGSYTADDATNGYEDEEDDMQFIMDDNTALFENGDVYRSTVDILNQTVEQALSATTVVNPEDELVTLDEDPTSETDEWAM